MKVIGQAILTAAGKKNAPLRKWLNTWTVIVEQKIWHSISDIWIDFPSADGVTLPSKTVVTVFNVKGNVYRLLTLIFYDVQTVLVLEVITHAEYDKDLWKAKY